MKIITELANNEDQNQLKKDGENSMPSIEDKYGLTRWKLTVQRRPTSIAWLTRF
jgi:hypothetical protein